MAFRTIGRTLRNYFLDRKLGTFPTRVSVLERKAPRPDLSRRRLTRWRRLSSKILGVRVERPRGVRVPTAVAIILRRLRCNSCTRRWRVSPPLRAAVAASRWQPAARRSRPNRISITTGGTGGVYYPMGGGMANILSSTCRACRRRPK